MDKGRIFRVTLPFVCGVVGGAMCWAVSLHYRGNRALEPLHETRIVSNAEDGARLPESDPASAGARSRRAIVRDDRAPASVAEDADRDESSGDAAAGDEKPDKPFVPPTKENIEASLHAEVELRTKELTEAGSGGPNAARLGSSLEKQLDEMSATAGFDVESVECRATVCMAKLRWGSTQAAFDGVSLVPQHDFLENCATEALATPKDEAPDAGEQIVFFHCQPS